MVQHEPHFILEIVDNSFGSLAMGAYVNFGLGGFSIQRDWSRGTKVGDKSRRDKDFLHMLCVLDGFLDVSFKSMKLFKFLVYLVSSHGWFGLSTQPTPRKVDRWDW
nr:hypothetical protein [Tanacetum cinerariifolium]